MTRILPGFSPFKCCKVSSPILPAPITSTVLSAKESKTSLARSTATLATDSLPWSMPVRSRTSLPTRSADWNTVWKIGPTVLRATAALYASRTWPSICPSPRIKLSRLAATRNKWPMTPSSW